MDIIDISMLVGLVRLKERLNKEFTKEEIERIINDTGFSSEIPRVYAFEILFPSKDPSEDVLEVVNSIKKIAIGEP